MKSCRQSYAAVAIAVCVSAMGCSPDLVTPGAKMFTGDSGGCGNCFVYSFNETRTVSVTVRIDEPALGLSVTPVDIEIDSQTVTVEVLQFADPAGDYFCDDVGGDPQPIATWKAVAGKINFERTVAEPPKNFSNSTHKVSVIIKQVQLKNGNTGATVALDEVEILDVWVGWLPG